MKHRKYPPYAIWVLLLIMAGCLEPYLPPSSPTNVGYLVVDGFLNTTGTITVRLSRTTTIADTKSPPVVTGAAVFVEQRSVKSYPLQEQAGTGVYALSGLVVDPAGLYRLRVRVGAKDYFSDYVEVKQSPPIDSVYWEADELKNGVQIWVAAHDPTSKARFYQWTYEETWQHDAFYNSRYIIQNGAPVLRPSNESIYRCWSTENSSKISLGSTEKLAEDVIHYPLTFLDRDSRKISSIHGKYSILVKQNTLSEEAFSYWQQLQKTTENLGGLFDPLPSQVVGNMHPPVNTPGPVLGYFSAGSVTELRIFIDATQLPDYLQVTHNASDCPLVDLQGPFSPPLSELPNGFPLATPSPATTSPGACIDCRADGGTVTKPAYWPN
jgi:hypothetical protein